jgi:hypothetical protein
MVDNPWITPSEIAEYFNYTGRGRSPTTFLRHIKNMYKRGISRTPRLTLKPYEGCQTTAYFCRKISNKGLGTTLSNLSKDSAITYMILLSGTDFFLTSRDPDLSMKKYGLDILEKSKLYTPMYTIPKGWNTPTDTALTSLTHITLKKGLIPRTVYYHFSWSELDWEIYDIMGENIRTKIAHVARKTRVDYSTAKHHFFDRVLPACVVAHYFYPKGYDSYYKAFLRISSDYEAKIVNALEKLPCTSYVFPLEKELILLLFHEDTQKIITLMEKMEEKTIIDGFLLYAPLYYSCPDYPSLKR